MQKCVHVLFLKGRSLQKRAGYIREDGSGKPYHYCAVFDIVFFFTQRNISKVFFWMLLSVLCTPAGWSAVHCYLLTLPSPHSHHVHAYSQPCRRALRLWVRHCIHADLARGNMGSHASARVQQFSICCLTSVMRWLDTRVLITSRCVVSPHISATLFLSSLDIWHRRNAGLFWSGHLLSIWGGGQTKRGREVVRPASLAGYLARMHSRWHVAKRKQEHHGTRWVI